MAAPTPDPSTHPGTTTPRTPRIECVEPCAGQNEFGLADDPVKFPFDLIDDVSVAERNKTNLSQTNQ